MAEERGTEEEHKQKQRCDTVKLGDVYKQRRQENISEEAWAELKKAVNFFEGWPRASKQGKTWSEIFDMAESWKKGGSQFWDAVYSKESGRGLKPKKARIATPDGMSLRSYNEFMDWVTKIEEEIKTQ